MKRSTGFVGIVALLIATLAVIVTADRASAVVNSYTAALAGTNEVPSLPNGYTGIANITIDTDTNEVCVDATTNVPPGDPIILDHIHSGAAGVNGPIVVDFVNNLNTCVTANGATVANIVANPSAFYFNVHSTNHPGGALRGQLAQDDVILDCDRIAGTGAVKPPLTNAAIDPTAVSVKGPMTAGATPDKPVTTQRACTGTMGATVGNMVKVAGKIVGDATCNLVADPPITDPTRPLAGKLTSTFANIDPATLKPFSSQAFVRIGGGDDPLLPDEIKVDNGIVIKGVGIGADVRSSFVFAPTQKKGPADQSFIDSNSVIVGGVGSTDIGVSCIAGVPLPGTNGGGDAIPEVKTLFFGTDGTGLLGGVLDSSLSIVFPGA